MMPGFALPVSLFCHAQPASTLPDIIEAHFATGLFAHKRIATMRSISSVFGGDDIDVEDYFEFLPFGRRYRIRDSDCDIAHHHRQNVQHPRYANDFHARALKQNTGCASASVMRRHHYQPNANWRKARSELSNTANGHRPRYHE